MQIKSRAWVKTKLVISLPRQRSVWCVQLYSNLKISSSGTSVGNETVTVFWSGAEVKSATIGPLTVTMYGLTYNPG